MFDWEAAKNRLLFISKKQLVQFLGGPDSSDVYGFGYFCDCFNGTVYLVANTESYYRATISDFNTGDGSTDPEQFKWDIGNWKYPGGLFPSASTEQREFDDAWTEFQIPLSQVESIDGQKMLEEVCREVLKKLIHDGNFSKALKVAGFSILGPDDFRETVLEKKQRLENFVKRSWYD